MPGMAPHDTGPAVEYTHAAIHVCLVFLLTGDSTSARGRVGHCAQKHRPRGREEEKARWKPRPVAQIRKGGPRRQVTIFQLCSSLMWVWESFWV